MSVAVVRPDSPVLSEEKAEKSSNILKVQRVHFSAATLDAIKNNLRIGKNSVKFKVVAVKGKTWKKG